MLRLQQFQFCIGLQYRKFVCRNQFLRYGNRCGIRFNQANTTKYVKQPVKNWKTNRFNSSSTVLFMYRTSFSTSLTLISGFSAFKLLNLSTICVYCDSPKSIRQHSSSEFDWKRFIELVKHDVWYLIGAVLAALGAALMNIAIPIKLGEIVNIITQFWVAGSQSSFTNEMQRPVLNLLGLYIIQSATTFTYIYLLSNIGERLATRMRNLLFNSILRQDLEFFDKTRTGDLVDCVTSDVQEFKSAFKSVVAQGLRSSTQIVGCTVSLYKLSPTLTAAMLLVVPSVVLGGTLIGSLLRVVSRSAQEKSAEVTVICEETVSNIRTVRAFANEELESARFYQACLESQKLYQKLGLGIALFQAGTNMFLNGIVLASLCTGGYLVANNEMNAGNLMSFLVATQTIQRSLAQLSLLFGSYVRGIQAGSRVFMYINLQEKIYLSGGKILAMDSLSADIEFDKVTFAYPTRPQQVILKDFSLKVPAGKTVAIVGTSGNGKSTIVTLLERFYDVDGGCVRLSGVDLRDLDPSWLRSHVLGLINQEPVLFATSIMENIRYGRPSATDQAVFEAAKTANADSFIQQFPEGYETILGERGVTVSGGQKQRIAIARALIKNPTVLILDEATSALDTESEKVVQQALEEASRDRTVLIIAHRLSTIQHADIIVVLNKGNIVEMGNHTSLMQKKGFYWNLMNQQQTASENN